MVYKLIRNKARLKVTYTQVTNSRFNPRPFLHGLQLNYLLPCLYATLVH